MQLYLDMDGVLADFDKRAFAILGMHPHTFEQTFGSEAFWRELQSTPDFYNSFDPMPDMDYLIDAVDHLDPVVLTGLPRGGWAEAQKRAWLARRLPRYEMIACRSKDKCLYCQPGDILIDDRVEARKAWENAGGIFVLHLSAKDTIRELKDLSVI
jgi:hypothetical protein